MTGYWAACTQCPYGTNSRRWATIHKEDTEHIMVEEWEDE